MLLIFAGLPGSGKTTLAVELARRIGAAHLRIDSIEQAMSNSSLKIRPVEDAGYAVGCAMAGDNLRVGRTVVADSVNPLTVTRDAWRQVALRAGRPAIDVEIVCSDLGEHRRRVESRTADLVGQRLPTWQDVVEREYHAWDRERIVIDTAGRSPAQCIAELQSCLSSQAMDQGDGGDTACS